MTRSLLAVNAGSATLKFRAYGTDGTTLLLSGLIDRFGEAGATLALRDGSGTLLESRTLHGTGRDAAVAAMINTLADHDVVATAVVHRVVHGGTRFTAPVRITPEVHAELETLIPLAPLHQPASLGVIDAFARLDERLQQIACFDTMFHATMPPVATRFGIARHWHDDGIRRYGFHGLSYAAIARRFPQLGLEDKKVVVCHLGSGSSACAISSGRSVASSMGFSAAEGLMMGTRPGNLDPEVVLYWMEHNGLSVADVRKELYKQSGLFGVSGISADMRTLLDSPLPEAREAVELYCYRCVREIGALAASMRGLDAIVFTAGIGERSPEIRARVLQQLGWLGVELDHAANLAQARRLTTATSSLQAFMLPTDEEGEMARLAAPLLANSPS